MHSGKAYIFLFFLILILDQFFKFAITHSYIPVDYIFNSGISFGLLKSAHPLFRVVALSSAYGVLFFLSSFVFSVYRRLILLRWGIIIWTAGICGNIVDRVWLGKIIDFITIDGHYYFNFADVMQLVGFAFVVISLFYYEKKLFYPNDLRRLFYFYSKDHRNFILKVFFAGTLLTITLTLFCFTYFLHQYQLIDKGELVVFSLLLLCSGLIFNLCLAFISWKFSQGLFGPLYAFERHIQHILAGSEKSILNLRDGDFHPQLIKIANDIQEYIDEKNK